MPRFFSTPSTLPSRILLASSILASAAAMEFFLAGIDMSKQTSWLDFHCNHTELAQAYADKGARYVGTKPNDLSDLFHATSQNLGFAMEIIRHCNTAAQQCMANASALFTTDNADNLASEVSTLGALFNCCVK